MKKNSTKFCRTCNNSSFHHKQKQAKPTTISRYSMAAIDLLAILGKSLDRARSIFIHFYTWGSIEWRQSFYHYCPYSKILQNLARYRSFQTLSRDSRKVYCRNGHFIEFKRRQSALRKQVTVNPTKIITSIEGRIMGWSLNAAI